MKRKTINNMYKNFRETLFQLKSLTQNNTNSCSNLINKNNINYKNKRKRILKKKINLFIMSTEKLSKGKYDIKYFLNKKKIIIS